LSRLRLTWIDPPLSICRLAGSEELPDWATRPGALFCAVRTANELSIVCEERLVPDGVRREGPFLALKVAGPLALSDVGVLSSLLVPLAEAGISAFVVSSFDTDYVLVSSSQRERAAAALTGPGHSVA
jgi:hypothetical protein